MTDVKLTITVPTDNVQEMADAVCWATGETASTAAEKKALAEKLTREHLKKVVLSYRKYNARKGISNTFDLT